MLRPDSAPTLTLKARVRSNFSGSRLCHNRRVMKEATLAAAGYPSASDRRSITGPVFSPASNTLLFQFEISEPVRNESCLFVILARP